jgi:hypothetical protein
MFQDGDIRLQSFQIIIKAQFETIASVFKENWLEASKQKKMRQQNCWLPKAFLFRVPALAAMNKS